MGKVDHPDYVTITEGMRGFFCVHLTWNSDYGGFYEPVNRGFENGTTSSDRHVVNEGKSWARDLGVEFRL